MTEKAQKQPPLIPRKVIFSNPEKTSPSLSPDGSKMAFLAPVEGVLNIFLCPYKKLSQAKPITNEKKRDIRGFGWSYDKKYILFSQDHKGDENYHIFRIDLKTGKTKDLTPFPKVLAQIVKSSQKFPNEILVALNNRKPEWHDIYRLNIDSGKLTLVEENNAYTHFIADEDLNLKIASKPTSDGGHEFFIRDKNNNWKSFEKISFADSSGTHFIGFDKSGKIAYKIDNQKRDKSAFYTYNFETKEKKLIAESDKADIDNVMFHPTELTPEAWSIDYTQEEWSIIDSRIKKDFSYLTKAKNARFDIIDRTLSDDKWIVRYYSDSNPSQFYIYERNPKNGEPLKLTFLFTTLKKLEKKILSPMLPVIIKSRDGLDLVSYLTIPAGSELKRSGMPKKSLPLILYVHGGPWARDSWGLSRTTQWLANRGYAVLSVNYRGSTGFGKKFINAGNKEWAGKMHDDLIDAVNWAIDQKIADPKKIAIMGGSYGGYAALVGLTFTPDIFACGVSIVGPSNLITLIETIPPYWKPDIANFYQRVGDINTVAGKKLLQKRSPLTFVDRIKKPLLILQGEHDPRVKKSEADQIVESMKEKSIPVTYVLYHDEGHGFVREPNQISSNAITEQFLAENLGGRKEPIKDDFNGANFTIVTGKEYIAGLNSSLSSRDLKRGSNKKK